MRNSRWRWWSQWSYSCWTANQLQKWCWSVPMFSLLRLVTIHHCTEHQNNTNTCQILPKDCLLWVYISFHFTIYTAMQNTDFCFSPLYRWSHCAFRYPVAYLKSHAMRGIWQNWNLGRPPARSGVTCILGGRGWYQETCEDLNNL